MEEPTLPTPNDLLREFVLASDEASDGALETLYSQGIEPLAAAVIRHKLRVSLRIDNEDHLNQTGLDLLSAVKTALLPVLRRVRASKDGETVENLNGYVRAAALNAFRQFLRERYPVRLRLRNKVRYILTRRAGLAIWKDESGNSLCGRAEMTRSEFPRMSAGDIEVLRDDLVESRVSHADPDDNSRILELIETIFERIEVPLAFEDLVSILWAALGMREAQTVADSDAELEAAPSQERNVEHRLDDRLALERLWAKICGLPLRHRRALLLNLHDEKGDNLLAIFSTLGIASIRQIAAAIEYETEELAALWHELPLDDLTIAARMGLTRQQVINLRHSARASLRRGAA